MSLDRILVVNDDTEDILAIQQRLPGIAIVGVSQFEISIIPKGGFAEYGLIVIDNDANNLEKPKGAATLEAVRKAGIATPVVYTSFQPVMVPDSVRETSDVTVVKTGDAAAVLAALSGTQLAPIVARARGGTTVLMTYNTVENFPAGVYNEGKLVVVSFDKQARELAPQVAREQLERLFGTFSFRRDRELLDNVIIYDGISGCDMPGQAAASIGHDARMVVKVAACTCDWERKERLMRSTYVDVFPVWCGGREDLGLIADTLLGIVRPPQAYTAVEIKPGSPELAAILAPAEKFHV